MIEELENVDYLEQIVVTLSRADAHQLERARTMFRRMKRETRFVWNNGQRIEKLYEELRANDLSVGPDGKGRSCWMACGYVLSSGKSDVAQWGNATHSIIRGNPSGCREPGRC